MKKEDIELLAPAGSFDALKAAVQNGANAIYLGGQKFGARAFAHNFDYEALKQAVNYCHLRNVKLYVTVNTLYTNQQIEDIISYIQYLYEINVDALIIQDMGLFHLIKNNFPDIEIHMSTQASVRNLEGVKYFEEQQVDRVVLAREMSIKEISEICHNCDIDIEVFVHGALCMSYSGQCLMSSMIAKRSGNKGECGQPCRLPYQLKEDNKIVSLHDRYLLSPKDLCSIENVPQLIEAGIKSFKVEGRMKRPEYVGEVIKAYRKAIDTYFLKQKNSVETDILNMKKVFNRGFTKGFLFNNSLELAKKIPGNQGVKIGKMVEYSPKKKLLQILLEEELYQGDRIYFPKADFTRTITKLYKKGKLVNHGKKGDLVAIELDTRLKMQDVFRVVDSKIVSQTEQFLKQEHVKLPVQMSLDGVIHSPITLTLTYKKEKVTVKSDAIIEEAYKTPLSKERILEQLSKLGNTTFTLDIIRIHFPENGTFPIKELNNLRREAISKLETALVDKTRERKDIPLHKYQSKKHALKGIVLQVNNLCQLEDIDLSEVKEVFVPFYQYKGQNDKYVPYVPFLYDENQFKEFLNSDYYYLCNKIQVNDFGALHQIKDKEIVLGYHMNVNNNLTAIEFNQSFVVPYELSKKDIQDYCIDKEIYFTGYSQIKNMNMKHCIISDYHFSKKVKNCQMCKKHHYSLIDRKSKEFKIITDNYCNNYIIHSHRFYFDQIQTLNVDYLLLNFIDESHDEIERIIVDFKSIIQGNKSIEKRKYDTFLGYFSD